MTVSGLLAAESSATRWWAMTSDGEEITSEAPASPSQARRGFATSVAKGLGESPWGGLWTVAWLDGGRFLCLVWQDGDGDVQIVARQSFSGQPTDDPKRVVAKAEEMVALWALVTIAESERRPE